MKWFLFLMGGVWVIAGIFLLTLAGRTKKILNKLLKTKNLKTTSFIPLIAGVLLAYSASASQLPWFVTTLSLLALAKGLLFYFAPEKKIKPFIDWWLKASLNIYRLYGLVVLALGIFFLYRVA